MLLAAGRQLARRGAVAPAPCCAAAAAAALAAGLRAPPPPPTASFAGRPRRFAASAAALPLAAEAQAPSAAAGGGGGDMVEEIVEPREAVYDTFYDPNNRNFVIVTGNVGREPRFTTVTPRARPGNPGQPEPVSLLTFSVGLAVPGRRPSGGGAGAGGQQRAGASSPSASSATDWLPIKAWGEVADAARGRVHRGTLLVVSGTLRTEPEAPSSLAAGGSGGASSSYGGGDDGASGGQAPRTRAYIHAKSIGIVTRRPASAADAMGGEGQAAQAGGGWGSPEPMQPQPQQQQQPQPYPQQPQQQQPYQQQQAQQPPPYQQAAAPQDPVAAGPAPTDRASATELLWRDWAAHGAGGVGGPGGGGGGWFDNRQRKRSGQGNARQPDFRRKNGPPPAFLGTAFEKMDALWIDSSSTPAWVMERL